MKRILLAGLAAALLVAVVAPANAAQKPSPSGPRNSASIMCTSYDDRNGDGRYDDGEPLIGGVHWTLTNNATGGVKEAYADSGVVTFAAKAKVAYTVRLQAPYGYRPSGPTEFVVTPTKAVPTQLYSGLVPDG